LQAVGTVGAVIAAFIFYFWDKISNWWNRPTLDIAINFRPPYCHGFRWIRENVGHVTMEVHCYWFRMTVSNRGNQTAKNVEVVVSQLRRKVGDVWERVAEFLPCNLGWTHTSQQYMPLLLPQTTKEVELGRILDPAARLEFDGESIPGVKWSSSITLFRVALTVNPVTGYNILRPGEYEVTCMVGAENCKPVTRTFILALSGSWEVDEGQMFKKGIEISRSN
jgi:hypothetical protein